MEILASDLKNILKKYDRRFDIRGYGSVYLREHGGCCALRYKGQHVGSIPPKIYEYTRSDWCAYDRTVNNKGEVVYTDSRPHRNLAQVLRMVSQYLPGKDVGRVIQDIKARQ